MSEKVIEAAGKTAVTASGGLSGGAGGAFIGTLICPGPGTVIGYLAGTGAGILGGLKASKKMFG